MPERHPEIELLLRISRQCTEIPGGRGVAVASAGVVFIGSFPEQDRLRRMMMTRQRIVYVEIAQIIIQTVTVGRVGSGIQDRRRTKIKQLPPFEIL